MTVGPMSLGEHLSWFAVLSLFVFLVYNGLHVESVVEAVRHGLKRWVVFVLGTGVLALVSNLLSHYL
jgi:hypothetical protein